MKTFTTEQLSEIIQKHHTWLNSEEGGERANLRSADLSSANLRSADLRYADLRSADLSSADLRSADLRSADLRYADLRYANLRSADLRYADLRYADLSYADLRYADLSSAASILGAVGNLSQIKSVQCDLWPVTYTADKMQIGCQFHTLTEWWAFSEEEIQEMDSRASAWWSIWKPILKTIIEASPAVPYEAPEKGAD
jgi:uncharacterized protein YjbI with pentapeptide repeats